MTAKSLNPVEQRQLDDVLALVRSRIASAQRDTLADALSHGTTYRSIRKTSPSASRPTSTAPRCRTGALPASASRGRRSVRVFNPTHRRAWLAVHPHHHRDRQRRHALPGRFGDDGSQPPRPDPAPHHPSAAWRCSAMPRVDSVGLAQGADARTRILHPRRGRPRRDAAQLDALAADITRVLGDVRAAVGDWQKMQARVLPSWRKPEAPPRCRRQLAEDLAFLRWLADDHFTFLGHRSHELVTVNGEDALKVVPGSGLGILRESGARRRRAALPRCRRRCGRTRACRNC